MAALLGATLGACAAAPPAAAPDDDRRRPDGVSLDPPPALPAPVDGALAADGVAALRTPIGTDAALTLLHAYARAIATEDVATMAALHTGDAAFVLVPPGQSARTFPGAASLWERRFARMDYGALAGAIVVREADATVRRVPVGEPPQLPVSPDDEGAPSPARDVEVVVHAPVATSRAGGQSLLGSELVLYLRRVGDAWRVAAVVEDYALP